MTGSPVPATGVVASALVVEDHVAMRTMMAGVLRKLGFDPVVEADSVAAALDHITTVTPALALVDLRLPDGTGEDVVRALRAGAHVPATAVVVMTADTDTDLRARLLRAGADTFVVKSEGIGAIRQAITAAATEHAERG